MHLLPFYSYSANSKNNQTTDWLNGKMSSGENSLNRWTQMNLYIWLFYFWLFISSISYTESNEADEKVQVKSQDKDLGRACEPLIRILIELKAARKQEERQDKDNEKQGGIEGWLWSSIVRSLSCISLSFLVFMYLAWVAQVT